MVIAPPTRICPFLYRSSIRPFIDPPSSKGEIFVDSLGAVFRIVYPKWCLLHRWLFINYKWWWLTNVNITKCLFIPQLIGPNDVWLMLHRWLFDVYSPYPVNISGLIPNDVRWSLQPPPGQFLCFLMRWSYDGEWRRSWEVSRRVVRRFPWWWSGCFNGFYLWLSPGIFSPNNDNASG